MDVPSRRPTPFYSVTISTCRRIKSDPYLIPHTKINSKQSRDINVRPKTRKILEENRGQKLHNIGFGSDFLDKTPKAKYTEEKMDKLDFMKIKTFHVSKNNINRIKRQSTE